MVGHVWTVLCARSVTDRETNNISLIDVVEQVTALGLPGAPPPELAPVQMELVSLWPRLDLETPATANGRVRLTAPDGSEPIRYDFGVDLSTFQRLRTQGKIGALPLRGAGCYWFEVELQTPDQEGWRTVARVPLQVTLQPQETGAQPVAARPN